MTQSHDPFEHTLDLWLDGQLDPQARAAFEEELRGDRTLQARANRAQSIDDSLTRVFGHTSVTKQVSVSPRLHLNGAATWHDARGPVGDPRVSSPRPIPWLKRLAVAAALAGVILGGWQGWRLMQPAGPPYQVPEWRTLAAIYQQTVADGFEPTWVCDTDEEFQQVFRNQYGQTLTLEGLPTNFTALGLSYSHSISPQTTCVLIDAAGEQVMVFVDRIEVDSSLGGAGSIYHHRRELGKLVLYEVSAIDHPVVLHHLTSPEGGGP